MESSGISSTSSASSFSSSACWPRISWTSLHPMNVNVESEILWSVCWVICNIDRYLDDLRLILRIHGLLAVTLAGKLPYVSTSRLRFSILNRDTTRMLQLTRRETVQLGPQLPISLRFSQQHVLLNVM